MKNEDNESQMYVDTTAYDEHVNAGGSPRTAPGFSAVFTVSGNAVEALDRAAEDLGRLCYPLYCVDRGKHGTDDVQYYGPFTSHDEALAELPPKDAEPDAHIRRCRRVKPSEIRFNVDEIAEDLAAGDLSDPFDWLVDELDEAARNGELPDVAWFPFDERIVDGSRVAHSDPADFPLPTAANCHAWIDRHLQVDAWICEGDE